METSNYENITIVLLITDNDQFIKTNQKYFSTVNQIILTEYKYSQFTYFINYTRSDFELLDIDKFVISVKDILINSFGNNLINIFCLKNLNNIDDIIKLNYLKMWETVCAKFTNYFQYNKNTNSIDNDHIHGIEFGYESSYGNNDIVMEDVDLNIIDDTENVNDDSMPFNFNNLNEYDDDDDDEDEEDLLSPSVISRNKNETSKIFKDSKKIKKLIHRHGLIISKDKNSINSDIKTINKFLKNFIPGKSKWIKEFRKDISKRWIGLYTMTNSQLKKLTKAKRSTLRNNSDSKEKKMLDITRKLFNRNSWDDPNR